MEPVVQNKQVEKKEPVIKLPPRPKQLSLPKQPSLPDKTPNTTHASKAPAKEPQASSEKQGLTPTLYQSRLIALGKSILKQYDEKGNYQYNTKKMSVKVDWQKRQPHGYAGFISTGKYSWGSWPWATPTISSNASSWQPESLDYHHSSVKAAFQNIPKLSDAQAMKLYKPVVVKEGSFSVYLFKRRESGEKGVVVVDSRHLRDEMLRVYQRNTNNGVLNINTLVYSEEGERPEKNWGKDGKVLPNGNVYIRDQNEIETERGLQSFSVHHDLQAIIDQLKRNIFKAGKDKKSIPSGSLVEPPNGQYEPEKTLKQLLKESVQ